MLQRDSFYYIPDLMPWSPTSVERNLPLDSMLEIAKMGQAQIDAQLQAIGKIKSWSSWHRCHVRSRYFL
jgi:hypothetical protein